MAKLIGIQGPEQGKMFRIAEKAILGREQGNEILINNTRTSRKHAIIVKNGGHFHIVDLNSRNGTLVNNEVVHERLLKDNDYIHIGTSVLKFIIEDANIQNTTEDAEIQLINDKLTPSRVIGTLSSTEQMGNTLLNITKKGTQADSLETSLDAESNDERLLKLVDIANKRLKVLYRISEIGHQLNLKNGLSEIMTALFELFPQADRGVILLKNDKGELLPAITSAKGKKNPGPIQVSHTIVQQAMQNKESLLSANAMQDERFKMGESVALNQIRSVMCVPIIYQADEVIGVIQLDSRITVKEFTETDLDLLSNVGSLIAVSIKAATTHKQLLEKEKLERDLSLATTIQQSFLPQEFPTSEKLSFEAINIPARAVGGDLYDIFSHPQGGVGVVIGDVSGKGVAAALYMAQIISEFRIHSRLEKEPEQIFVKINNNLSNRGTLGMFVTLQYIHIQENARKAYIINGGHLPPIIYSQKTKQVRQLEVKSSPPVGIVPNQNYVSTSFDLYPEDIILLYTDGVYEAKSPDGERFETRGIIKSLKKSIEKSAPSILKALVEDVHHWTEREDHFDDFTTLLIKVS